MPAYIDPVVLITNRARDPAHIRALFEHDRLNISTFDQFKSGCQSSRTRSDYQSLTLTHYSDLSRQLRATEERQRQKYKFAGVRRRE